MSNKPQWMEGQAQEITQPNGDPIPDTMDFPIDPPAEIGPVRTAYSTAVVGKPIRSDRKRWLIIIGVYLLVATPIPLLIGLTGDLSLMIKGLWMMGLLSLPTIPITHYFTYGSDWVTYIGELGLARHKLNTQCGEVDKTVLFEFANAIDLFTHSENTSVNMVHTGTTFKYSWRDTSGRQVFKLSGIYDSKRGKPKAKSPYHIANAAEASWSMYLAEAMNIELQEQGSVHFKVNKNDWIKVGPGFLEFHFKNKDAHLAIEDIKAIGINQGRLTIKSNDAGRFGGKGRYQFEYAKMANARLFLMYLEQLYGYRFEK